MPRQTAVITGAAGGIGLALARELARRDHRVAMLDLRADALDAAVVDITSSDADAELLAVPTDVTDAASVDAAAALVLDRWGAPDLVINNAGIIGPIGTTWEGPLDEWELAFGVNVWGVLHGMRAFMPAMVDRDAGRVVNIASVASWSSAPMMGAYGATKHAVFALTESAYRELKGKGSRVEMTVVCPTTVRTALIDDIAAGRQDAEASARDKLLAAREAAMTPEDVAALIVAGVEAGDYLVTTNRAWLANAASQRVAIAAGAEPPLDREPPRAS